MRRIHNCSFRLLEMRSWNNVGKTLSPEREFIEIEFLNLDRIQIETATKQSETISSLCCNFQLE